MAKLIFSPAAELPESTVMANMFAVDPGVSFVLRVTFSCFHVVCEPEMDTFCVSNTVPAPSRMATDSVPLNLEAVWKR